jgi:type IV fimbrial biogenesis protein FimT
MKKLSGFSLIELMVTLSVAAVVLWLGLPNYQDTIQKNMITTSTNAFVASVNFMKNESYKRGAVVSMCIRSNSDPQLCDLTGNAKWEQGWLIFADANLEGPKQGPTPQNLIKVVNPFQNSLGYTLRPNAATQPPCGLSFISLEEDYPLKSWYGSSCNTKGNGGATFMVCQQLGRSIGNYSRAQSLGLVQKIVSYGSGRVRITPINKDSCQ